MRKIEQQMNTAIANGKSEWKSGNTCVVTHNKVAHVFLHGNKIAEVGDNFIVLMDGGWQSKTTKSRLNAILSEHGCAGECVFQQNFEWFVNMKNAKGEDLRVPFFSGMRLN